MTIAPASLEFPAEFLWGAATAAFQIEGAHDADGKGPSIWDDFSHTAGKTFRGHHGDVACDHYHQLEADVERMKEMGLAAYRFSISWPRILPDGTPASENAAGVAFYRRLLDLLKAIYEKHQEPKKLIKLHDLAPLLERMQNHDQGLLVREQARELYEACKIHDLL